MTTILLTKKYTYVILYLHCVREVFGSEIPLQ
jgi:hypothetical protein